MVAGAEHALNAPATTAEELYLDLLKKSLTRLVFGRPYSRISLPEHTFWATMFSPVQALLGRLGLELVRRGRTESRDEGRDWPADAETMIGLRRLDNLQLCVTDVIKRGVPGDLIETGVWRGGATILMRAVLRAYGDTTRNVWVADSFEGLPPPSGRYAADLGDRHSAFAALAIPVEEVRRNFERYGLLDEKVRFLVGFFQETLASAPIERLAVLRLDGDMYESTIVPLRELYPKLSRGGYVIVDDYGAVAGCRQAVDDYRSEHGITEPLQEIDWTGVYWQRSNDR